METENQEFVECQVCQREGVDRHEIFMGKHRQKCIKYGIQIKLCWSCHNMAHGKIGDTVELCDKKGNFMSMQDIAVKFCKIINIPYKKTLLWLNLYGEESKKCLEKLRK